MHDIRSAPGHMPEVRSGQRSDLLVRALLYFAGFHETKTARRLAEQL
jgi:hypothetical protein